MWKAKATSTTQLLIFIYTEAVNISSFLLDSTFTNNNRQASKLEKNNR